jgi:predicted transposase YbfD/YdcC
MASTGPVRILSYFASLPDPRVERTKRHQLGDILAITLCAVLCGADSWVEVADFGQAKRAWLGSFLELPNGIPSHDTFGRVFAALDPVAFEQCFLAFVRDLVPAVAGERIAIDGKVLRGAHAPADPSHPLRLVRAWAAGARLTLGQVAVAPDSNEITAIPKLLGLLDLRGCVVTIDAIGCQTAIAQAIHDQQADYILELKANQPDLRDTVETYFAEAEREQWRGIAHQHCRTVAGGHGRVEVREHWLAADAELVSYLDPDGDWAGLTSVAMVRRQRQTVTGTSTHTHYYLTSLAPQVRRFAASVRGHWGIENRLHWVLDIAFGEDGCRVRSGHAAENLAIVRRLALTVLRQEATATTGIKARRLRAGWDERYLLRVLHGQ